MIRTHVRRSTALAWLVPALIACGPRDGGIPRPKSEPAPKTAAVPSDEATCSQPEVGPKVGDTDGEFTIIWTRPAPKPVNGSCSMSIDALYATRVGVSASDLAVDLKLESAEPNNPENRSRGTSAVPKVIMSVDGCPVAAPRARGFINYGGADGRIVLPRAALPRGDLVVVFEAFDRQHTMLFANDDKGLRTVLPEEMKGFVEDPGNPATGELPGVGYEAPDCSKVPHVQGGQP